MTAQPEYTKPDPGSSEAVADGFALLWHAVGLLSEDIPQHLDQNDAPVDAVVALDSLTRAWRELGEIKAYAESVCVKRLRYGRNEVAGFVAEVKGGDTKPGNWRHDEVAWAVVAPLAVDENGEVDTERAELIGKARDAILNCAGVSYWRLTQLRSMGIDPSEFSSPVKSTRSVHLTTSAAAVDAS